MRKSYCAVAILTMLFSSCENYDLESNYRLFKNYKYNGNKVGVFEEKASMEFKEMNGRSVLSYVFNDKFHKNDSMVFVLHGSSSSYHSSWENNKNVRLYPASEQRYSIDENEYTVMKFHLQGASIDGVSSVFWLKEYGVIIISSQTWGNIKVLEDVGDNERNRSLRKIVTVIMADAAFFSDCASHD